MVHARIFFFLQQWKKTSKMEDDLKNGRRFQKWKRPQKWKTTSKMEDDLKKGSLKVIVTVCHAVTFHTNVMSNVDSWGLRIAEHLFRCVVSSKVNYHKSNSWSAKVIGQATSTATGE